MSLSNLLNHCILPTSEKNNLQAQRLFHGRGHAYEGLHHITIDWLPPVILITLFAEESSVLINDLAHHFISTLPACQSVQLQHRYQKHGEIEIVQGKSIQDLVIQQDALNFVINLGKSRNTGLFLDMQYGRQWVQSHCQNLRTLNLFAYTCGFSVSAITGGANSVLNVDMSRAALSVGRENHRLNQHDLKKVSFEKLDIFKSFSRFKKRGPFDLLICDPPTFQKGSVDIVKDYPKIIRRLDQFMAANSTLLLCLNAPDLGRHYLLHHMAELAPRYTLIDDIKTPEVFVEAEGKGLTILCFKDLSSK